jgi:hypothetical protein
MFLAGSRVQQRRKPESLINERRVLIPVRQLVELPGVEVGEDLVV